MNPAHAPNVLVVDDDPLVLRMLDRTLRGHGYRTVAVGDPRQARRILDQISVDAVVTDLDMSMDDGRYFAAAVSADCARPLLVVTGLPEAESVVRLFGGTAPRAWLGKPFAAHQLLSALEKVLDAAPGTDDEDLLATTELATSFTRALALHDPDTEVHTRRVATWTRTVARRLGLDSRTAFWAQIGALLHDVGKIGIPDSILRKTGPLDAKERALAQRHPELGAELIAPVRRLAGAREVVLHHHERWDGSGYPAGLAREAIPMTARVFAPIDAYDSMTSRRPYREPISHAEALARLAAGRRAQFDPRVVDAILSFDETTWSSVRRDTARAVATGSGWPS